MASLLLAVIYLAFIGLGLPDSLLGSGWPVMHEELGAPLSAMGLISMIIAAGTVVSSLASDFLTRKLGTGLVTFISVLMTAGAMLAFSFARTYWLLCVLAVPYGLGAGGVDAALNNYVALYYKSRHMSWLHCFWGVGALISPFIMSYALAGGGGWGAGYSLVSYIQFGLCAVLLASLPLWKNVRRKSVPPRRSRFRRRFAFRVCFSSSSPFSVTRQSRRRQCSGQAVISQFTGDWTPKLRRCSARCSTSGSL